MGNKVEEYKRQFQTETLELIVRINWCWEKGHYNFPMLDNNYIAQARFDKAINVKTGELLENGYNWLEWLAPKKAFGFQYGYKWKKGAMYRLLVREYIYKENDKFRKYYVEQVLEKDIHEPRLDIRYNFESKFIDETADVTVLIKQRIHAWATEQKYRIPKAVFIASIDNQTNELSRTSGILTWIEKDSHSNIKFNFDDLGIYHVRVRKSREHDNQYMLLDVINKAADERLEAVKKQYMEPVVIRNELGEFKLDRRFNCFEGNIDYFGEKCPVNMMVEEGETTVDLQLNKLKEIVSDLKNWDNQVREYAVQELLELANEWQCDEEDEPEITREEFIQRIGVPEILIHLDGMVEIRFETNHMFTDHCIVVYIDENGKFHDATIEG